MIAQLSAPRIVPPPQEWGALPLTSEVSWRPEATPSRWLCRRGRRVFGSRRTQATSFSLSKVGLKEAPTLQAGATRAVQGQLCQCSAALADVGDLHFGRLAFAVTRTRW